MTQREKHFTAYLAVTLAACFAVVIILRFGNQYYRELNYEKTQAVVTHLSVKHSAAQSSSTAPFNTNNWKTYKSNQYGFEFQYPAQFIASKESTATATSLSFGPDAIGFQVLDFKFDPKKIENIGGIVDNPTPIAIGNKTGYSYGNGDGPWSSTEVATDLKGKTLNIGFQSYVSQGSSPNGVGTLYSNTQLIKKILSTFKFTN